MSSITFVKEIPVGLSRVHLFFEEKTPLAEWNNEVFNHIWALNQRIEELSDPDNIKEFAEISNFLWKGLEFRFIEYFAEYQKFYQEQMALELKCPGDIFPYRLTDYKIFDVGTMHEPRLEKGILNYFVYHAETFLPYKVVLPFPYTSDSTVVHYQILPLLLE